MFILYVMSTLSSGGIVCTDFFPDLFMDILNKVWIVYSKY